MPFIIIGVAGAVATADVVMPIRNGARFIAPALQGIIADPKLGTLFIVDDGSTDNWEEAAGPYLRGAKRKIVILRQEPSGVAAALNRGLQESTATYVARMDADDISKPGRLEAQINWLEQNPHIAAVGTQVAFIGGRGTPLSSYPTAPDALRRELFARGRCAISHPSVMMRRDKVLAIGGYRDSFLHAEDYDLWLRLAETDAVANLDLCLLEYRRHPGQVSEVHKVRQSFSRDLALLAARERAAGNPDPTASWTCAPRYEDLQAPWMHPVIQKLAVAYDAIDKARNGGHGLSVGAVRAIPPLARAAYLGETRRVRYDLIKKAGVQALKRGLLIDALDAYCTLARCRTLDSKFFRKRVQEAAS